MLVVVASLGDEQEVSASWLLLYEVVTLGRTNVMSGLDGQLSEFVEPSSFRSLCFVQGSPEVLEVCLHLLCRVMLAVKVGGMGDSKAYII